MLMITYISGNILEVEHHELSIWLVNMSLIVLIKIANFTLLTSSPDVISVVPNAGGGGDTMVLSREF